MSPARGVGQHVQKSLESMKWTICFPNILFLFMEMIYLVSEIALGGIPPSLKRKFPSFLDKEIWKIPGDIIFYNCGMMEYRNTGYKREKVFITLAPIIKSLICEKKLVWSFHSACGCFFHGSFSNPCEKKNLVVKKYTLLHKLHFCPSLACICVTPPPNVPKWPPPAGGHMWQWWMPYHPSSPSKCSLTLPLTGPCHICYHLRGDHEWKHLESSLLQKKPHAGRGTPVPRQRHPAPVPRQTAFFEHPKMYILHVFTKVKKKLSSEKFTFFLDNGSKTVILHDIVVKGFV